MVDKAATPWTALALWRFSPVATRSGMAIPKDKKNSIEESERKWPIVLSKKILSNVKDWTSEDSGAFAMLIYLLYIAEDYALSSAW